MKAKELKQLSAEEAAKKLRELREQLVLLRVKKQAGQVEKPTELRFIRRDIARLETLIRQKGSNAA